MESKTKLISLINQRISNKEMDIIHGGSYKSCECACVYENQGGTSTADNAAANYEQNITSPKGCNRVQKTDDGWEVICQNHE